METAIFTEKIVGFFYAVVGFALLVNKEYWLDAIAEIKESRALIFLSSFISLLFGLWIVLTHNVWEWTPGILVTIAGWLAIAKGFFLMVWPEAWLLMIPSRKSLNRLISFEAPIIEALALFVLWGAFSAA